MDQDPTQITLKQYGFILGVALLGGIVSWVAKVRRGEAAPWAVSAFIGELSTSAFAGLLAFWLCTWAGTPQMLMACIVGVAGHMGTRAIGLLEVWAEKRWNSLVEQAGGNKP